MSESEKRSVLVVDDEPDVRLFLKTILEDAGFEVSEAANGKQALDRVKERRPDVISLDLVMPKMSGLKFYRYLKKDEAKRGIPFVVVTAHGKDEFGAKDLSMLQKEAKNEPVFFLEKPVKPAEYIGLVRRALGLEGLRREAAEKLLSANEEKLQKVLKNLADA